MKEKFTLEEYQRFKDLVDNVESVNRRLIDSCNKMISFIESVYCDDNKEN